MSTLRYGIYLVWRGYQNGTAQPWSLSTHFIPKQVILDIPGGIHSFILGVGNGTALKELLIYPDRVAGHSNNVNQRPGYSLNANGWVLYKIYGI